MNRTLRGFTLLELIVVIAIIGVLSVIILPSFTSALSKANNTKMKQNIINTIKRYDVLAKWEFEEGSGSIAKDTAVNPIDNTVQNNATIPGSGVTWSANTYSSSSQQSLLFDGTNYLTTVNNTYPKLDNSSFSFSLWFRRTGGFGLNKRFISKWGGGGACGYFIGTFDSNDHLVFYFGDSSLANTYTAMKDQLWHNLMLSYDIGTSKLVVYLDGKSIGSYNMTCPMSGTNNNPLLIGGYIGGNHFIGNIDDVYYFNDVIVR